MKIRMVAIVAATALFWGCQSTNVTLKCMTDSDPQSLDVILDLEQGKLGGEVKFGPGPNDDTRDTRKRCYA